MDNEIKTTEQKKAERQKALRFQRNVRIAAILLAIVLSIVSLVQSCATQKAIEDLAAQIAAKKAAEAQTETIASPSPAISASDADTLTLSFTGLLTPASPYGSDKPGSFENYYDTYGEGYFFQNIRSIFEADDLTIGVLGCSFTTADPAEGDTTGYRADPGYTGILRAGGIDAVAVSGGHVMDFGEEGYVDTLANLDNTDILRFGGDYITTYLADGVTIGLTAVNSESEDAQTRLQSNLERLKEDGAALLIAELYAPQGAPELAIDAANFGADAVILYGADDFGGIELYEGTIICHSIGTLLSGGDDLGRDAMILQISYDLADGLPSDAMEWEIRPVSTSTDTNANTYCPTIAATEAAGRIMEAVYERSAEYPVGISAPAA